MYGIVNGKAVNSRDEFIFASRGFGPIESDAELITYAEKVTSGWYDAGWHRTFTTYYLSDYALSRPYSEMTCAEFARLVELQKAAEEAEKTADLAREWRKIDVCGYADNSVEEIWEDKNGNQKTVLVVGPHGDCC